MIRYEYRARVWKEESGRKPWKAVMEDRVTSGGRRTWWQVMPGDVDGFRAYGKSFKAEAEAEAWAQEQLGRCRERQAVAIRREEEAAVIQ